MLPSILYAAPLMQSVKPLRSVTQKILRRLAREQQLDCGSLSSSKAALKQEQTSTGTAAIEGARSNKRFDRSAMAMFT